LTKSKAPPRQVQRATGWSYTRARFFVGAHRADAEAYAEAESVPLTEAFVALALAVVDTETEC